MYVCILKYNICIVSCSYIVQPGTKLNTQSHEYVGVSHICAVAASI